MPDVTMPNGDIVNFPDDMPKDQIKGLIASKFPDETGIGAKVKGFGMTAAQGVPLVGTFIDEMAAETAAPAIYSLKNLAAKTGLGNDPVTYKQARDFAYKSAREPVKNFRETNPKTALAAELGTSVVAGLPMASLAMAKNGGKAVNLGTTTLEGLLRGGASGAGIGALQGALYAAGAGEGGAGERLGPAAVGAATGAALGGVVGAAGGGISSSLAARARRLLELKRSAQTGTPTMTSPAGYVAAGEPDANSMAIQKVITRLRQDYPDDAQFNQVLNKLKSGQVTLGELGGEKTKDLALGAAQYPSGKSVTQEFFEGVSPEPGAQKVGGAIDDARANVTQSIQNNVSGNTDYFGTLDEIVERGRKNAAPFYEKSYNKSVPVDNKVLLKPEIQTAIAKARKQFPSELEGFSDNSVKVLDYAKRVIDDDIGQAVRAGENNFARSRTQIKKELLSELDESVPFYKKARELSGDYLGMSKAMETGRGFKGTSQQIARDFADLSDMEKEAFKAGVVQNIREQADAVRDSGNVHSKIFGSPETRAKLKAILPQNQYKKLEDDLWASDRIYSFRNKVLGNSTTASKQLSAQEFAGDTAQVFQDIATKGFAQGGLSAATKFVKKYQSGLSDKTAREVARILTAKSESDKLKIIRQISDQLDSKKAVSELKKSGESVNALQVYFAIEDSMKPVRDSLSSTAGTLSVQPLTITVHPGQYTE